MPADLDDWGIPLAEQPSAKDYSFDLEQALSAVVSLSARIPDDAFTAPTLGTQRGGNAVLINSTGLLLTIGYLITEAEEVWLRTGEGKVYAGHVVGIDQATGFGLVQAHGALELPALPLGDSRLLTVGNKVIIAGAGGRPHSVAARIVARQEFAGYWEYLLDEAIFTAPTHPNWGGTAVIGPDGELAALGSLQVPSQLHGQQIVPLNMSVPIELLQPIFEDLRRFGRVILAPRPWLGVFAAETSEGLAIVGFSGNGPAQRAGLHEGDIIRAVAGKKVKSLAAFYRHIWSLGEAGVEIPLTLERESDVFDVCVTSRDRNRFLKAARLQ
jgi:S1-C subfamily serine protease